jgi:hypothetical protein
MRGRDRAQRRHQRAVELDREHALGAPVRERRRERPEARPDVDDRVPRSDPGVDGDRGPEVGVDQEVLAERLRRLDAIGLEERPR